MAVERCAPCEARDPSIMRHRQGKAEETCLSLLGREGNEWDGPNQFLTEPTHRTPNPYHIVANDGTLRRARQVSTGKRILMNSNFNQYFNSNHNKLELLNTLHLK